MAFETFAVHAACIRGVEAIHVTVEVSLAGGVPGIQMLGIPSMEVMESRGRIRCAMRSAGFEIPRSGITVNLAPGDIRKTGSGFDLPIAIAVLAADGQIPRDNLDRCLIAGELGLDGTVLPVKGEVAFQLLARDMGLSFIAGRSDQHVPLAGVDCGFIDHLSRLAHGMGEAARHYLDSEGVEATFEPELDYADVLGQEVAKRGMALAAAGELGLLMIGSPGSGKTMLMRAVCGLIKPTEGEISIDGQRLGADISFPPSLGMLIEAPSFLGYLSGYDNLKLIAQIKGVATPEDIRSALRLVGLDADEKKKFRAYSLGMKQRLGIAAAIMEKPKLLVLDEPTNALDEAGVEMLKRVVAMAASTGREVLLSSHDGEVLEELADRVYCMRDGAVVKVRERS